MANSLVRTRGNVRQAVQEFFQSEARNYERIKKSELGLGEDDELPPYVHREYPKILYPADDSLPIEVATEQDAQQKLGEGYCYTQQEAKQARDEAPEPYLPSEDELDDEAAPVSRDTGGRFQKRKGA
jgi:hypothetical protein